MGMVMEWIAVAPSEADPLLWMDGDEFVGWIQAPDRDRVDVDKMWHGVHAVLTGRAGDAPGPMGWAVLGGDAFADDLGYGPPRLLDADRVERVAGALDDLGTDGFTARIDAAHLVALDIYPGGIWAQAAPWLGESFEVIRAFYRRAADDGRAVVAFLT